VPGLTKKDHNSSLQKALTILLEDKIKDQQQRASEENKPIAPQEERDKVAIAHEEFSVSTAKKAAEITRASDIDERRKGTQRALHLKVIITLPIKGREPRTHIA
jgi:hypothetical protein